MGSFYVNFTVKGASQEETAKALKGYVAFISPEQNGCVVVVEKECDTQDEAPFEDIGKLLSQKLSRPVLGVLNYDDDLLRYTVFSEGQAVDTYTSTPEMDEMSWEPSDPVGGDAELLCKTFGKGSAAKVEKILRKRQADPRGYAFAIQRHEDLVKELGLPEWSLDLSYKSCKQKEYPDGLNAKNLAVPPK